MKSSDFEKGKNVNDFDTWLEILKVQRPDIYDVIESELFGVKQINVFSD